MKESARDLNEPAARTAMHLLLRILVQLALASYLFRHYGLWYSRRFRL
jgi:hypothetical protein